MVIKWEEEFTIAVSFDGTAVRLVADKGGLISLARILLTLAQDFPGAHIHLDTYNSLEDGSVELILERM